MFYFKRKKVELKFFTTRSEVNEFAPVSYAKKHTPSWWRELPKSGFDFDAKEIRKNMKGCVGVTSLLNEGFIMPMWTDAAFIIGEEGTNDYWYQFADGETEALQHNQGQRGSFAPDAEYQHLKIESPWFMRCKQDIPIYFGAATWHVPPSNMHVLTGIISPKYQSNTHINTLFKRTQDQQRISIELGHPLAQMIPLTEKQVVISTEVISKREQKDLMSTSFHPLSFSHSYSKIKKIRKEKEQSKCPFGFGGK